MSGGEPGSVDLDEATFELVGPVVGVALTLLEIREKLETLDELVRDARLDDPRWAADLRERMSSDLGEMLDQMRREARKVEKSLVRRVSTADQEGPEMGHTWRFTVQSRTASGTWDEETQRATGYADAEAFTGVPWSLEVRGWSLVEGLERAVQLGMGAWRWPDGRRLDHDPDAEEGQE